jgi:hypothetical protein
MVEAWRPCDGEITDRQRDSSAAAIAVRGLRELVTLLPSGAAAHGDRKWLDRLITDR